MSDTLVIRDLTKSFAGEAVLRGVDFRAPLGTTTAVLGRSGSGKTTLLRAIAGLDDADRGRVVLGDRDLTGVPPRSRDIVYLSQSPLLFPHLDVRENLAFGLKVRRRPSTEVRAEVDQLLERLDMTQHATKSPEQLSGGQRQRVAFGRALIVRPQLLLLDEPFSALDAETRQQMQALFREVVTADGMTSLFVTHDLKEALTIGQRFAFIADGRLTAYETKADFIEDPRVGAAEEIRFWSGLGARPQRVAS